MSDLTAPLLVRLLASMESNQASDLFITEGRAPAARVHGRVLPLEHPPTTRQDLEELLERVLIGEGRRRFEERGDLDTGLSLEDGRRFRLNLSRERGHVHVVARAVPSGALDFDELRLPLALRRMAEAPRGLLLVTGATGSGKSTTLAAMVHHVNQTRRAHIVTIEDPIEFVHTDLKARVTQREVGADTATFAAALRHVVRQSPDVILIGELRDPETMQVAISAALTGHLVLASVHTIDATQTLQRILSYFPEHLRDQVATDLSMCLVGIMSQRLVPRVDKKGRVVACELLSVTPPAAQLLRERRIDDLQDLMRTSEGQGMTTFNQSLLGLYQEGHIHYEVGLSYASNPDEFALAAKGMSTGVATFRGRSQEALQGLDMKGLLAEVTRRGASDLHLAVGRPPILRVSGALVPLGSPPLTDADMRMLLFSILSARQRSVYEIEREIDFALAVDEGRRFRVNAYYQKGRMAAALRAIPGRVPDAAELGLPDKLLELGTRPQGLLLVVGPTGAGKSTTLACLVDRINRTRACRVITVEDPIEYAHGSAKATVDQREVYADTKSFAAALKYILRQDPDVILVGEMRDLETVSAVLTAAETGHLVFATLHSNDAAQAIDRIVDVYPPHQHQLARSQLAACLLGVVSQRLLPRRDGTGRVAAFELMVATSGIRALIREGKSHQVESLMEASRKDGCVTMDHALRELVESGRVEHEDAVRFATSPRLLTPSAGREAPEPARPREPEPAGDRKRFPWNR